MMSPRSSSCATATATLMTMKTDGVAALIYFAFVFSLCSLNDLCHH
jgi:hypothetical protein